MGIDFVVDLGCEPKNTLGGAERLVNLVKARSRASAILAMMRRDGDERPPDQLTFTVEMRRPTGVENREVTVQSLFDEAKPLELARAGCAKCAANRGDAFGYGCYRSIAYPIERSTEQWMLERLPEDPTTTAGQFLRRAIVDFKWNGAQAAEMRKDPMLFESRNAIGVEWRDGFEVTSNQIFHMLFNVGHIQPTHAMMVALFFGVIPHDVSPEIFRDDLLRRAALNRAALPRQEGQKEAIAVFLRALPLAALLGVHVLIDG